MCTESIAEDPALLDGEVWFPIKDALHTLQEHVIQLSIPAREVCGVDELFVLNPDFTIKVMCVNIDGNR